MRGDSLEGYTKRSGRNRGRSPRVVVRIQLPVMAVPCYLVTSQLMARYCLTDSATVFIPPGLRPGLRLQPYRLVEAGDIQHILVLNLKDNTDNNDNGKNGRNCGRHKVTYNTDNGITSATEKLLLWLLLSLLSLLS